MYYTYFQNNKKIMKKISNYSRSHLKVIQKNLATGVKNDYNKK